MTLMFYKMKPGKLEINKVKPAKSKNNGKPKYKPPRVSEKGYEQFHDIPVPKNTENYEQTLNENVGDVRSLDSLGFICQPQQPKLTE